MTSTFHLYESFQKQQKHSECCLPTAKDFWFSEGSHMECGYNVPSLDQHHCEIGDFMETAKGSDHAIWEFFTETHRVRMFEAHSTC